METRYSRRSFLRMMAGASAALTAAACAAPAATPAPQPAAKAPAAEPTKAAAPAPAATAAPAAAPQPKAGQTKIQFMWWLVLGDIGLKAMEEVLKLFETANPNITVERIPLAFGDLYPKLQTMIAGGTPPDVFSLDNYWLTEMADKGALLELGPYIEKDKDFKLDVFLDAALAECVWKNKRYSLPYIGSTRMTYYNADLFQKKGLDTPDKLWEAGKWTWDKFLETALALTDRSGGPENTIYGFFDSLNFNAGGLAYWIWGAKGDLLNADRTKCLLNQEGAVAGIKYLQDLIWKHQVSPKAAAMKDMDLMATGRVAMWYAPRGLSMTYRTYKYNWDVGPVPVSPAGKVAWYKGNSMCASVSSKNKDQAWMLVKHVTGKEADQAWIKNGGATPRKDNLDTLMKSTPPKNNQYFYSPVNEGWARQLPFTPKWTKWTTESNAFFDKVFLDNGDVKKAMDELVPVVDKILAEK